MEQVIDWLNENELRAYPLMAYADKTLALAKLTKLPDNFLLDLQLVTSQELASSVVLLHNIKRTSSSLSISFGILVDGGLATSSQVKSTITTFIIPASPATGTLTVSAYPYYVRNTDGCLAVFGPGASELYTACNNNTNLDLRLPVEPAVCTQFNGAWLGVSKISATPEKVTDPLSLVQPKLPLADTTTATYLTGDVQFLEGYNFRVNVRNSLIDLEVGASYGLTMDCSTSFLTPDCLDCDKLVSYINGVPPDAAGNFRLLAGSNIIITPGTEITTNIDDQFKESSNEHSLFVGLTFQSTDICAPITVTPAI